MNANQKKYITFILFFLLSFLKQAAAADQMKSSEFHIGDSASQVSATVNYPFSIYIGDNISNVTSPVKALYFSVTGVYTGNGTLALSIDSRATTTKTFTLPSVSTPTPFEIIYKDDSNRINPRTGGTYSYTLNVAPSGVTISGLGIKLNLTDRYRPPQCGTGYAVYGDLVSRVFDATSRTEGPAHNSIMWKGSLSGGVVKFQLAASDDAGGSWTYYGGSSCSTSDWFQPADADTPMEVSCYSEFNNKRYFKYKVRICSDDCVSSGQTTPQVDDIIINLSP